MNCELELNEKEKATLVDGHGGEEEDGSAEITNEGDLSASREVTEGLFVDRAATCVPEESAALRNITTSKDLAVMTNNEQLLSLDQKDVSTTDANDGPLSLNVKTTSPTLEETTEVPAVALDNKDLTESIQRLSKEWDQASQRNRLLQKRLTGCVPKTSTSDGHLDRERLQAEQKQEYEENIQFLAELKLQTSAASDSAQLQADELRLQELDALSQVEEERRALVALKEDAAVGALSRSLGKEAARAKVQSVLTAEQLLQDELIETRLQHSKLKVRVGRLEEKLRDKLVIDPVQIRMEQQQVQRLKEKEKAEKQSEESRQLQTEISSSLEILSNVKEKLFQSQMEVEAKRQQLAELEAVVTSKKDLLTQTQQVHKKLQRDNLRLKEHHGLLGNRLLLRDFEDTVDASDHLEKHLEDLKYQQSVFRCGGWKKKLDDFNK